MLPGQCESSTHSTQYAPLAAPVLQWGVRPPQPSVCVHAAHTPRTASQNGCWPPHAVAHAEVDTGTH